MSFNFSVIRIPLEFCASAKRASQARRLNGGDFAQFFCGIRIISNEYSGNILAYRVRTSMMTGAVELAIC
jgi:hypothetical protein